MCVVENSGRFGGTYAAPITGLMIEKYLNDTLAEGRNAKVEYLSKLNLIPPRIYKEIRRQDSLSHAKDTSYLLLKGYIKIISDTAGIEDEEEDNESLEKIKKAKLKADSSKKKEIPQTIEDKPNLEGILPDEKKKPAKDSAQ
jgi:hypothetical protein